MAKRERVPLSGAILKVDGDECEPKVAMTDDSGTFRISGLAGRVRATVTREDFIMDESTVLTLGPGEAVEDLEIALRRAATVSGVVTYRGEPIEGAQVGCQREHGETDAKGRFRLEAIEPGPARLWAFVIPGSPGPSHSTERNLEIDEGADVQIDLEVFRPRTHVTERVTMEGRPIDGELTLEDERCALSAGAFEVLEIDPGRTTLRVTSPDPPVSYATTIDIPDQPVLDLPVKIPARGIRGRVVELGTERPIAHASIDCFGAGWGASTAADGSFGLVVLEAGRYQLIAKAEGYVPVPVEVLVEEGKVSDVSITLARPGKTFTLTGVVHWPDGRPACPCLVIFQDLGPGQPMLGNTARDGRFTITDIPDGTYTLHVSYHGGPDSPPRMVELAAANPVLEIALASGPDGAVSIDRP